MRRCKHAWDVVGRSYNPSQRVDVKSATGESLYIVERLLLGTTTVSLRCSKCGDVTTKRILGKWTDEEAKA